MATFLNFEGTTDGTLITGVGATGADALSNTGGTMEYDDDVDFSTYGLTRSVRIIPTGSGSHYFQRTTGINHTTLAVVNVLDMDAFGLPVIWVGSNGTTRAFAFQLSSGGNLQIYNAAGALIYQSTGVAPTTGLIRVAGFGTTAGNIHAAVFAGVNTQPISGMDSGLMTGQSLGSANFGAIRWGKATTGTYATPFNMAYCGWDSIAGFINPPSLANPPEGAAIVDNTSALIRLNYTPQGTDTSVTYNVTTPSGAPTPVSYGGGYYTVPRHATIQYSYSYTVTGNPSGEVTSGSFNVLPQAANASPGGMIEEIIKD